jgi:D-alanyl-lipoteichoic acid acyltransferase DltB (MBOAT superfamily)
MMNASELVAFAETNTLLVLGEQGALLRFGVGAIAFAALLQLSPRSLPFIWTLVLSLVLSAAILGTAWPAFAVTSIVGFFLVREASRSPSPAKTSLLLIAVVATFLVGRAIGWSSRALEVGQVGFSLFYFDMWMVLRLFTLIWEAASRRIEAPGPANYALWIATPLLLGGPLVRYSTWPERLRRDREPLGQWQWWRSLLVALAMIAGGLLVAVLDRMGTGSRFASVPWFKASRVLFFGPWAFYLLVGGQFALVASVARVCGVTVQASFDRPFAQTSIAAFWSRWNTTATTVFRDYFFYNRWGLRAYNVYANVLLLFLFVGLWHGANAYWILFGVFHGVLFCLYLATRPLRQALGDGPMVRILGWAVTYVCVCAAWYLPSKVVFFLWPGGFVHGSG